MTRLRTANLLGALSAELSDRLERQLKSHPNQTDSAMAALNIIGFFEGCSNNALSRALKLSHPATVRLVDKLEGAGLVESRSGADRRSVALYLSEAGRSRVRSAVAERCLELGAIVDLLDARQQAQLTQIAETLLRALTLNADAATHICRLCDDIACPAEICPVHQHALSLAAMA